MSGQPCAILCSENNLANIANISADPPSGPAAELLPKIVASHDKYLNVVEV